MANYSQHQAGVQEGTEALPYIITTQSQLAEMMTCTNRLLAWWELGNDIVTSDLAWTPLGTVISPFMGSFDGKGYSISNLQIGEIITSCSGFIGAGGGYIDYPGQIKNVTFINSVIRGNEYVGGVCGRSDDNFLIIKANVLNGDIVAAGSSVGGICGYQNDSCYISRSYFVGDIAHSTSISVHFYGGICGRSLMNCAIIHCTSICNISVKGESSGSIGGIVGTAGEDGSYVQKCYTMNTITVTDSPEENSIGVIAVGGLCGVCVYAAISESYAITNLTVGAKVSGIGGFVGDVNSGGSTDDCYASGSLTTEWGCEYVGGFCGTVGYAGSALRQCYAAVEMEHGNDCIYVGGFCGDKEGTSYITDCFFDNKVCPIEAGAGGTGKTTAQMQTSKTFTDASWNFLNTWGIVEGVYQIEYDIGTTKPVIGETLNVVGVPTRTCKVLNYTVSSGSWSENNAAGILFVHNASAAFRNTFPVAGADLENAADEMICNILSIAGQMYPTLNRVAAGAYTLSTKQITYHRGATDFVGRYMAEGEHAGAWAIDYAEATEYGFYGDTDEHIIYDDMYDNSGWQITGKMYMIIPRVGCEIP